jgi:hypothetical protein
MENLEIKHLAEDIAQTCQDIIKKETVHKVISNEDADKALEGAKKDPRANQEILQELSNKFFYIQNKAHLIIEVFKEIAEDQIYMSEKEKIPSLFEGTREIIEKNHSYYLSLQP